MCGIAGILDEAPVDAGLVELMVQRLLHRGPDGHKVDVVSSTCVLGHSRLSIIDQVGGTQPLWSADRRFVISFNGEIYNYIELRTELQQRGSVFQTKSDTEVIVEAYRVWGVQAFERFNGQFALGIFDAEARSFCLARDVAGEKPLYVCREQQRLSFASELKALIAVAKKQGSSITIDPTAIDVFLSLNYIPEPQTMVREIEALPAGSWLCRSREGSITRGAFRPKSANLDGQSFEGILADAASIRLRSEAPVGLFLSGGLDSTAVAVSIPAERRRGMPAFIADFSVSGFSEAAVGVSSAKALGLTPHLVTVSPKSADLITLVRKIVLHADAPLGDSSAVPLFLLSEAARRSVTVVLSGDGGDELLGGYLSPKATMLSAKIPRFLRQMLFQCAPLFSRGGRVGKVPWGEKAERFFRNLNLPPGAAHFAWNGMWQQAQKMKLLRPEIRGQFSEAEMFCTLAQTFGVSLETPDRAQLLAADAACYFQSDILAKVDRITMAHGLEARTVFTDPRLGAFVAQKPALATVQGGQSKWVLADLIHRALPEYNTRAPKQGFSVPIHSWFRGAGLAELLGDLISRAANPMSSFFAEQAVKEQLLQHQRRQRDIGFELWGLLTLFVWGEQFGSEI